MRVIITGGTGLIGRALADSLTADNHEVIVLRRSAKYVKGLPKGARAEQSDARAAAGWGHLADGAKIVPKRLLDMGYIFKFPEAEPAFRDVIQ
jgi:NAD dependent epimerase/dehydratase family enzyme